MSVYLLAFLGLLIVVSSLGVILARNSVHSVLFLVFVFFSVGGSFLLLGVEFLCMVFIMVYVGAIMVLFLFVVMMLNVVGSELKYVFFRYFPLGGLVIVFFILELYSVYDSLFYIDIADSGPLYINWFSKLFEVYNVGVLGDLLYIVFFLPFILSGVLLLISMISAIILTMSKNSSVKKQEIYYQTSTLFNKVVYLVNYK